MPEYFNYGQNEFRRTSTYDAHCRDPIIRGKILSIQYAVHWYGAGAAHSNLHFLTFNFLLEPLVLIPTLVSIFHDSKKSLEVIQTSVRTQLYEALTKDKTHEDAQYAKKRVDDGTADWKSFHSFVFVADGIEILFPPYEVASYAEGAHITKVQYKDLVGLMRPEYKAALLLG